MSFFTRPEVDGTALMRGQIVQPDGWVYGHRIHVNIHGRLAYFHHQLILANERRLAKTWERLATKYAHKHPSEPETPGCESIYCDDGCCTECACCDGWREYVVKLRAWLSR